MSPDAIAARVAQITSARADAAAQPSGIRSALVSAREIESWMHAQVAGLVGQLSEVESFPEATIAEASRGSLVSAAVVTQRADTLRRTPALAGALADGVVTVGHVDAVTAGAHGLGIEQRRSLFARVEELVSIAATATIDQFDRRVAAEADRLRSVGADGCDAAHMCERAPRHLKAS